MIVWIVQVTTPREVHCGWATAFGRSTPALRNEEMSSRGKGSVSGRVITPPQRVE
jgi:hypothetical protein